MPIPQPTRSGVVPWTADVLRRYREEGAFEGLDLGRRFADAASVSARAEALLDPDAGVRLTFEELADRVDGLAERLLALGLRPDDRLVCQLPNTWENVVLLLGCLRAGIVPVLALPSHRGPEVRSVLHRSEARALAIDLAADPEQDGRRAALELRRDPDLHLEYLLVARSGCRPDGIGLEPLLAPAPDAVGARRRLDAAAPPGDAVALLKLSGGTTGAPKLVPRSHDDLAYMMRRAAEITGTGPGTTYLAALPLGHGFPLTGPGVLGTLLVGGRVVLASSPSPTRVLPLLATEGVTHTSVVPAVAHRWLEAETDAGAGALAGLRLVQVGGSTLAPTIASRLQSAVGGVVQQVFGMSEGLLCMTRPDDPADVVRTTVGRPVSDHDELRVVRTDGTEVHGPDEVGILLARGPYTVRGYYRSPELDVDAFVGGWYRTGDLVRRRADGNLVIEGRDKDVVNRGGEKITAQDVEDAALSHPAVDRAAVVAAPHPELGEIVCLIAVLDPACAAPDLAAIRAHLSGRGLAPFKLPERLVEVDELPLTPVGKVDKRLLRERMASADAFRAA